MADISGWRLVSGNWIGQEGEQKHKDFPMSELQLIVKTVDGPIAYAIVGAKASVVTVEAQYHQSWKNRGGTVPDYTEKSDVEYYQGVQSARLAQAQAFDQAYPHPEQPAPRDTMRRNETPCSAAIDAALAPLRHAIAAAG